MNKKRVFELKGNKCHYCGSYADTVDHILPRSRGGVSNMKNLIPACKKCNSIKGSENYWSFMDKVDPFFRNCAESFINIKKPFATNLLESNNKSVK